MFLVIVTAAVVIPLNGDNVTVPARTDGEGINIPVQLLIVDVFVFCFGLILEG